MFYIKGRINKRSCTFKIDTGSDVILIREKLLEFSKQRETRCFENRSFNLKYSTGERIPVKFKVRVLVEVGELSIKLPVYVVDMKNDCLLGNDFLSAMNFEGTFASFFSISFQKKEDSFWIMREANRVLQFLKELFEKET